MSYPLTGYQPFWSASYWSLSYLPDRCNVVGSWTTGFLSGYSGLASFGNLNRHYSSSYSGCQYLVPSSYSGPRSYDITSVRKVRERPIRSRSNVMKVDGFCLSGSSSTTRHPPPPPLPARKQDESGEHDTYADDRSTTNEPAQSFHNRTNGEGGNKTAGTRVVAEEDLAAIEVGQGEQIGTGNTIPDNYFIEEKTWVPGVA